ncbi:hypothetical protein A5635_21840 [Mycobacterium asiaticum]|uniref:PLD phosphodiesterase domain-containing protein n=2 Tax=Mycobacterium asiaticum TaxID=1790 RepID=A0A1A3NM22_MYCAS|nr:hypothetical protein A5635_21840 [Mycobacterium asiaticum]
MSAVPEGVDVALFTRWRPEEVAAGISDTGVLKVLHDRGGAVYLHDRLHAKFYRSESAVLLGSANLTATALGWSFSPNIELLVESTRDRIVEVENYLSAQSTEATAEMAREVDEIAKLLPEAPTAPEHAGQAAEPSAIWVPHLRMPSDLFAAYSKGLESMTSRSASAAAIDLVALDLPVSLSKRQFQAVVGHRMSHQVLFQKLDQFLDRPRRFGEVRDEIGRLTGYSREQADDAWQTTMRWMLEFLPYRYVRDVRRHSEIFSRRTVAMEPKQ